MHHTNICIDNRRHEFDLLILFLAQLTLVLAVFARNKYRSINKQKNMGSNVKTSSLPMMMNVPHVAVVNNSITR